MPVGYDTTTGSTVYESSLPPKANGKIGGHAVAAIVSACIVAGVALAGLGEITEHFSGSGEVLNNQTANAITGIADGQGAVHRTINGVGQAVGSTIQQAGDQANQVAGAIQDGANQLGDQANQAADTVKDNVNGMFDVSKSEIGKQILAISTTPDSKVGYVQDFLNSGKVVSTLPDGDLLLKDTGAGSGVRQISKTLLGDISPEILNRQPLLKELHEAAFGKPFDFGGLAERAVPMAALGGGVGLGVAGIAQSTITPPSTNPYKQAHSIAQTNGAVYQNTILQPQQRANAL